MVASPIHTSSHYQTFETPFLHELVGGDRNMEQTNLVVTPDGKTWDEVTRDTSYMGNQRVCVSGGAGTNWQTVIIHDEWRGSTNYGKFNKDFAIAYDRIICLVSGQYKVTVNYQIYTGSEYHEITKNGTTLMRNNNTTLAYHDNNNLSKNVYLERGDYLQDWGSWKDDSTYSAFEVERV
jgi:hypothetical protein